MVQLREVLPIAEGALLAVYELVLREDDGEAVDLEEALTRAEEIEKSLKAVSVNLLNLK